MVISQHHGSGHTLLAARRKSLYCFSQLVLSKQSACRPIATQMFARAFVANKCASNGKWKHMQTQGWRGRALALHTFWNCARVAENCAQVAGNCARVAGSFSLEHFTRAARQPQKMLEYQRVLQVIANATNKSALSDLLPGNEQF